MLVLGTGTSLRLLKVLLSGTLRLYCMFCNLLLPLCCIAKLNGFRVARTLVELFLWELRSLSCKAIAIKIFEVCMSFDTAMAIEWLPRSENDKADYLSTIVDLDDWSLSAALFQLVDSSWGSSYS